MTALTIIQNACAWLAISQPTSAFSSTDPQVIQLRMLLNLELVEQWSIGDAWWKKLLKQWTFTTVAADSQTLAPLPDDLGYIIANTMWDRTLTRPVVGPLSPEVWQAWKARPVLTSVLYGFRLRGEEFLTAPNPPGGDTVAYEYISNRCVYTPGQPPVFGPSQTQFLTDDDSSIFDEAMLTMGCRWRFLRAKGLDYAQEYKDWSDMRQRFVSRDKAMPTLSAAGPMWPALAGPFVPSFNFPGP